MGPVGKIVRGAPNSIIVSYAVIIRGSPLPKNFLEGVEATTINGSYKFFEKIKKKIYNKFENFINFLNKK